MKLQAAIIFAIASAARAECPNSCSGHGSCDDQLQCTCHLEGKVLNKEGSLDTDTRLAQWTGADCSQLTCPRGVSWTRASGTQDHTHGVECSDMGVCNRLTGQCVCHAGFGGIACARSDCPNECNGHGMCRSNKQFAEKYARTMSSSTNLKYFLPKCTDAASDTQYQEENCARDIEHVDNYFNTFMATYEDAWDSNLQWGCDCDAGFFGADCSLRECPSNFDPLDPLCEDYVTDIDDLSITESTDGTPIILTTTDPDQTAETYGDAYADYLDQFGKEYIDLHATGDFQVTYNHFADFSRSMHPIHHPTVDHDSDGVITDAETLEDAVTAGHYVLFISPDQVNLKNRYEPTVTKTAYCAGRLKAQECSGRGICDHALGLCQCFDGYTMEDCSEPEELV